MRVSFFNYHYDIEGTARGAAVQVRSIAAGLERHGHTVDLHFRTRRLYGKDESHSRLKEIAWLRKVVHTPRLLLRNKRLYHEECVLIDAFRPDVVMAVHNYCNLSALLAARRCGIPYVVFADAPMEYEYSTFYPELYSYPWLGRSVERLNIRSASRVICISEVLKAYLMRYGAPATRLSVISNGVDHFSFRPRPPDQEIVHRFGLAGRRVVGFIGSFQFFSDVEQFVELARGVCDSHRDVAFMFVGEGEMAAHIQEAGARHGLGNHLIFVGAVNHEQVPRFLSVMDVVICYYRGDYLFYNSPMKLFEYMAAGKPVLASALGQIKELISDGHNGMLFEWDDTETMRRKLFTLIEGEKLRKRIGAHARETIENGWTWDIQTRRIAEVLSIAGQEIGTTMSLTRSTIPAAQKPSKIDSP